MSFSFLLLDDHDIVRAGLKYLIKTIHPSVTIDDTKDANKAFALIKENNYSLIIIDLYIPGYSASNFVNNVLAYLPHSKIIIFTSEKSMSIIKHFYSLGIKGFLNKEESNETEITNAIKKVLNGNLYVPDDFSTDFLLNKLQISNNPFLSLSKRELEITVFLIKGVNLGEIAINLNLSTSTIGTFKYRVFTKLKVKNLFELKQLSDLYPF